MAQWFGNMGYRAVAEHNRHYDLLMVPLAVDAWLAELARRALDKMKGTDKKKT